MRWFLPICAMLAGGCGRYGFESSDQPRDARDDGRQDARDDAGLGPPRVVQRASGSTPNAITVSVALPANVVAGDVLVVATSTTQQNGLPTVTDSQGDIYALAVTTDGGAAEAIAGIYVATAGATAATTITCRTGVIDNIHCHVYELTASTGVVDASGTSVQIGPDLTVTTTTSTTLADAYVLAYFACNNASVAFTADASYGDAEYTVSSSNDIAFTEGRVAAVGVQTATATANGSSLIYVDLIAAFAPVP